MCPKMTLVGVVLGLHVIKALYIVKCRGARWKIYTNNITQPGFVQ